MNLTVMKLMDVGVTKLKPRSPRAILRALALFSLTATLSLLAAAPARGAGASDEEEVRRAMQEAFERLRAGDYGALYDALPTASQQRISRERFVGGLGRTRGIIELDRLEIGAVRVAGDLAVLDTVLYGRMLLPAQGEGKVVARQYMVREGGRWRVTTGDPPTVRPLLAAHPQFARRFPPTEPRIYLKRDGRWVSVGPMNNPRRAKRP